MADSSDILTSSLSGGGGGISDIVSDTTPQLGGQLDVNGNAIGDGTLELLTFTETASAVNNINITNAATTGAPVISVIGDDANIDIDISSKGTGEINLNDTTNVTGNITVTGTVDGRDVATDGTKLDGIEALADVTDETNVKSSLDGAAVTSATVATGDKVLIQDIDDSDNLKTVTAQSIADLGGGGGGAIWTEITTTTASTSSTIDFIDGVGGVTLDTTYNYYMVLASDITASSGAAFLLQMTVDGGTTWNATEHNIQSVVVDSGTVEANSALGATSYSIMPSIGTGTGVGASFQLEVIDPADTTVKTLAHINAQTIDGTGDIRPCMGSMYYGDTSAVNGLRFSLSTGTIDTGKFTLYGLTL